MSSIDSLSETFSVSEGTPGWRMVIEDFLVENNITVARDIRPFVKRLNDDELKLLNKGLRSQSSIVFSTDELAVIQQVIEAIDEEWDRRWNNGKISHKRRIVRGGSSRQEIALTCSCGWRTTVTEEALALSLDGKAAAIDRLWNEHMLAVQREQAEAELAQASSWFSSRSTTTTTNSNSFRIST